MLSAGFRFFVLVAGIVLAFTGTSAFQSGPLHIWKIGSPHEGDTPDPSIPPQLESQFKTRGLVPEVRALPARDLFPALTKSVAAGTMPDLLVTNNHGVISGITTRLGQFPGIAQDPAIAAQLVRARGTFDALLGPRGGWTYLLSRSRNYRGAREVALARPDCDGRPEVHPTLAFADVIGTTASAYMRGDAAVLDRVSDPERMASFYPPLEPAQARDVRICSVTGNMRLAVVSAEVSFESGTSVGHVPVLLVFRKPSSQWQLLVAALDPISNGEFVKAFSSLPGFVERAVPRSTAVPVVLRAPENGKYPPPGPFGSFEWDAPAAGDVVADIAEFARWNDARLFVVPRRPGSISRISSGRLVSARTEWKWRIWSLTRDGILVFSEVRTFTP